MSLRGVLFDLDGTLADTALAEREAWDALAAVIETHVPSLERDELRRRYDGVFEPNWTGYLEGRLAFGEYRWNRLRDAIAPWADLDEALFEAYRRRNATRSSACDSSTTRSRQYGCCGREACESGS